MKFESRLLLLLVFGFTSISLEASWCPQWVAAAHHRLTWKPSVFSWEAATRSFAQYRGALPVPPLKDSWILSRVKTSTISYLKNSRGETRIVEQTAEWDDPWGPHARWVTEVSQQRVSGWLFSDLPSAPHSHFDIAFGRQDSEIRITRRNASELIKQRTQDLLDRNNSGSIYSASYVADEVKRALAAEANFLGDEKHFTLVTREENSLWYAPLFPHQYQPDLSYRGRFVAIRRMHWDVKHQNFQSDAPIFGVVVDHTTNEIELNSGQRVSRPVPSLTSRSEADAIDAQYVHYLQVVPLD